MPLLTGVTTQRLAPPNEGGRSNLALNRQLGTIDLGASAAGQYWAMRALHPCDETRGGGAPIPDARETQTASIEYRVDSVIAAPDTTKTWDCQVISLPFGEAPLAFRKRTTGGFWTAWHVLAPSGTFVRGGSIKLGTGDGAASPSTWFPPTQLSDPTLVDQTTGYRATYRGTTIILNASSLANEGFVTSGQWENTPDLVDDELARQGATPPPVTVPGGPRAFYKSYLLHDVPDDPAGIISRCPEAGQWEARKGVYMPMRFPNPAHQFTAPGGASYESPDGKSELRMNYAVQISPTTAVNNNDVDYIFTEWPANSNALAVSGLVNLNFGIMFFSGLNGTASLVVKNRTGLEMVPVSDSLAAAFVKDAPIIDTLAIDAVQATAKKLPLMYEARFNSLGAIVPAIALAAKTILPIIAPWLIGKLGGYLGRVAAQE